MLIPQSLKPLVDASRSMSARKNDRYVLGLGAEGCGPMVSQRSVSSLYSPAKTIKRLHFFFK